LPPLLLTWDFAKAAITEASVSKITPKPTFTTRPFSRALCTLAYFKSFRDTL